jgi:ribonuclease PH
MRALGLFVALLGAACSPPPNTCCASSIFVARDVTYVTPTTAPDAGGTTDVKLTMSASGNTVITFTRNGQEIVQTFDAHETP